MGWSSGPSISCEYESYGVRYPIGRPRSNLYSSLPDSIWISLFLSWEYDVILKTLKLCEEIFPNRCSSFEVEMAQILQEAEGSQTGKDTWTATLL